MAPGNNGASTTPEDDDPFGYLYADGQAAGATPPNGGGGGYGYPNPRSSYNHVRAVGERQYGQQQPQYGQQQVPPQQQTAAYNQPNAYYQAPETLPGGPDQAGPPQSPSRGGGRGSGGRGPNTRALLIGAVAVVAAVVIGIGVALLSDSSDDDKGGEAGGQPSGDSQSVQPSETASKPSKDDPVDLPKTDAKTLRLDGGTATATDVKGAKAAGGVYVAGFNKPGASLTWNVSDIPKDASYSLHVTYSVPGEDDNATMTVNGTKQDRALNMKNYAGAKAGDFEKGWTDTWGVVELTKGTNAIKLSCEDGNKCNALIDQMWLVEGTSG